MKTIYTLLACCLTLSVFATSSPDLEKVYTKLKVNEEVFSMSLSKNISDFFNMDVDFNGKEKWITGDFKEGKMLIVKKPAEKLSVKKLFEEENYVLVDVEDHLSDQSTDSKSDKEVYLFVNQNGNWVSEAHFVVVGEENIVVVTILGDIKVKNKH